MKMMRSLAVLAALAIGACSVEVLTPENGDTMDVKVDVAGGIAGVDYKFELRDDGSVIGLACTNMCDFQAGDTLLRLTTAQRNSVRATLLASGLPDAGRPVDFGTECCDKYSYRVIYSSRSNVRSFSGSMENFPAPLYELVRTLHLLYAGAPPTFMAQTKGLEGFSKDALGIVDARVQSGILEMDVTYGGGCTIHDVDAVAWTQWMESAPVRVGIAVAHDAHGDTCEVAVQRTVRFDLEPLRLAYAKAYGSDPATLLLLLEPAAGAPSGSTRVIEFSF